MTKFTVLTIVAILIFFLRGNILTISAQNEIIFTSPYEIVDTGIVDFYDNNSIISFPAEDEDFFGQDANYQSNSPSYIDNGDGTITDNVTGLMWQQDMGEKLSFTDTFSKAESSTLGGFTDWRVPTIKELYSLILFTGREGAPGDESTFIPFIDIDFFIQPYGDLDLGERLLDAQTWSSTEYVSTTMDMDEAVFGVNFVDGRIKGYPRIDPLSGSDLKMYARLVRGNRDYGTNDFIDNNDGTISDLATGLMWQQADNGIARDWQESLAYAENLY